MARSFELTTRINPVSRSRGDSATARAAYRACCKIECEREGRTHDYSRKRGRDHSAITLPKGSPKWAKDRARLWNGAEQREKNGKRGVNAGQFRANAQTARDYLFTFPAELSREGRRTVAQIIADHLVSTSQVAVDHSIHEPGPDGDEKNWHCHMMWTTRRMTAQGLGEKTREWDERDREGSNESNLAKQLRALVARTINTQLAAEGKAKLVFTEHQTFKDRGIGRKAQTHQGPGKTSMQRKQQGQARRAWFQKVQQEQRERQAKELAGLKLRQDFGLQGKVAELAQRGWDGARTIKRELDAARQADKAPEGMRRAFLIVTGRLGREAFDRQAREMQRMTEAKQKLADLKAELRIERSAYSTGQAQERAALIERHGTEDQQLQQALRSRESLDRSAEIVQRRGQDQAQIQKPDRQQEQNRGGRSRGQDFTLH